MANSMLDVNIKGPLFDKRVTDEVEKAIISETLEKVEQRMERSARTLRKGGRTLVGQQRNDVRHDRRELVFTSTSTLNWPRNVGTAWVRFHIGAGGTNAKGVIGRMLPNVLKKTAARIAGELS